MVISNLGATAKSPKNIAKTDHTLQNRWVKELLTLASILQKSPCD
jgi:hypothetical protein